MANKAIAGPVADRDSGVGRKSKSGFGRGKSGKGLKRGRIKARYGDTQKADAAFSLMIREAAGWQCARCGADHSEHHETLDASHYFRRDKYSVRYDPDNADALCHLPCHVGEPEGWEFQKSGEYLDFMRKKLGHDGFTALWRRSEERCKLSDARAAFWETAKAGT